MYEHLNAFFTNIICRKINHKQKKIQQILNNEKNQNIFLNGNFNPSNIN